MPRVLKDPRQPAQPFFLFLFLFLPCGGVLEGKEGGKVSGFVDLYIYICHIYIHIYIYLHICIILCAPLQAGKDRPKLVGLGKREGFPWTIKV